jgi:hypothetical protein
MKGKCVRTFRLAMVFDLNLEPLAVIELEKVVMRSRHFEPASGEQGLVNEAEGIKALDR